MKEWSKFLEAQEKSLGKETVDKWLRSFKVGQFDAGNLYLEPRDDFQATWFEEHMRPVLHKTFLNDNGRPIKVHLSSSKPKKAYKPALNLTPNFLDAKCTFKTYFGNLLSLQLLKDSIEKKSYNPIYLFGPAGIGKTHLLMAAAHFLQEKKLSCFFVCAETFTQHVVAAIRNGAMEKFRKLYRSTDVLLFDDAHLLAGKVATQEEFFHTFNALHMIGKPILLASAISPQALTNIEPRLVSRFEWGLVLPLQKLSLSELENLLAGRIEEMQFSLSSAAKEFLLSNFQRNPKTLVRALDALVLRCHLDRLSLADLSRGKTEELLAKLLEEEKKILLTPEKIVRSVSEFYGIKPDDIWGKSQTQECATPRQISIYLCRILLKMPFMKIGEKFDRDHSTVMTSVKSIQKKIEGKEISLDDLLRKIEH